MKFVQELWRRLSIREQWVIGWGGIAVMGLMIYGLAIDPLLARMTALDRLIPQKRQELDQLSRLQQEYDQIKGRVMRLDRQLPSTGGDFSLLALVESTVHERVGKTHLAGIRPQPSLPFEGYEEVAVEVKLEQVSLAQIVAFLTALDQAPQRLRTKRLEIKSRFSEKEMLDASIVVAAYELKAPAGGQPKAGKL
jgi:type II secretory pathway component PulM